MFSTTLWCNVRILIFHFFQWCLRRPFFSFWKVGIHIDMNLNTLEFLWYKLVFIYNKRFEGGPRARKLETNMFVADRDKGCIFCFFLVDIELIFLRRIAINYRSCGVIRHLFC